MCGVRVCAHVSGVLNRGDLCQQPVLQGRVRPLLDTRTLGSWQDAESPQSFGGAGAGHGFGADPCVIES